MSARIVTTGKVTVVGSLELHDRVLKAIESGAIVFTGSKLDFVEAEPLSADERQRLINEGTEVLVLG